MVGALPVLGHDVDNLDAGETYVLSLWARASKPDTGIALRLGGWDTFKDFHIGEEWHTHCSGPECSLTPHRAWT